MLIQVHHDQKHELISEIILFSISAFILVKKKELQNLTN